MARTKSNIVIRYRDLKKVQRLPVAKATEVAMGDLVDFDGTDLAIHAGEVNTYVGVALNASTNESIDQMAVATEAWFDAPLASGSGATVFGDGVAYSAGSNTADWEFTKATVDGIGWCVDPGGIAAGATGMIYTDSNALQSGFLFDALTTT